MEIKELKKKTKTLTKDEFRSEIKKVKNVLPTNYGVLIKNLYPDVDIRRVYNVVNYGIHDEEILRKLKFLVPSSN